MSEKFDFFVASSEGDQSVIEMRSATAAAFRKLKPQGEARQGQYHLLTAAALRLLAPMRQALSSKEIFELIVDKDIGRTVLEGVKDQAGLYRGFSRSGGKISSHAKFKPLGGFKMAALALVALEIATIITSTQHLKEIGDQLKKINHALDQIQDLLDDQRLGALKGNLMYLNEIHQMLERGALSPAHHELYAQQVESIYRECLQALHTADEQLKRRKRELDKTEKIKINGILVWKKADERGKDTLTAQVGEFSAALGIALLAQETAVMACVIGKALGQSPLQTDFRLSSIRQLVETLKEDWNGYGDILKTKFEKAAEKVEMRHAVTELALLVQSHRERPKRLLTVIDGLQQELEYGPRLEFLVKVEAGEVVDVRRRMGSGA